MAAVSAGFARASVAIPTWAAVELAAAKAGWGNEFDIRPLVADYPADSTAIGLEFRTHMVRLVRAAWGLGTVPKLRSLQLRAPTHTLGYTGQFSSQCCRYSTTFRGFSRQVMTITPANA